MDSPDWTPLREAILATDPNARRLALIRQIEGWLVQPWDTAAAACIAASPTLERAREVNALLNVVLMSLRREVGIVDGPAGMARFNEVMQAFQAGTLPDVERRIWDRANTAYGLWAAQRQQDPAVAEPAQESAGETAVRAALEVLIARQRPLQQRAVPGTATVELMTELDDIIADYRAHIAAAMPATPLHVDLCFWAAHACYAAARGWSILGRIDRAARLYAEAAPLYAQGDRPTDAIESADNARKLSVAVDGDLGAASRQDLRDLIERDTDPLARARAQARLGALAREANDLYDACEWADKAIANLVLAGFADPQATQRDALCEAWIRRACAGDAGAGALPLLLEVGYLYQDLLGTRHARWAPADAAKARAVEAAIDTLHDVLREIAAQPGIARQAVVDGLARYMPGWVSSDAAEASPDASMASLKDLGARIEAIKQEANVADAARDLPALQSLAARAAACVVEARATRLVPTIGLACHTEAYVRLRAGDAVGAAASALEGEALLLDGQSLAPHELAGHPQFDLLLELRGARLQALLMQADNEGLRALAQSCVQLVEARRWQVADPYQRGAFLASRTLFYEMAVLACFRLQRWDELLATAELIKSRAALHDRLGPERADADPALLARLGAVNAQLATASTDGPERAAALEQRRVLLGLLAVEGRVASADDVAPAVSVAALQASLAIDEAVVAWVWVATGVVLVLAITASGLHAERVLLAADELALFDDHVALVRGNGVTIRAFDGLVTRLAGIFLPPATRAFVAAARRLILSPHRALHLLPFHAAQWGGRFHVEQAAVRYVPNLASLLLPARDAAPAPARAGARLLALGIGEFAGPGEPWAALASAEDEARAVAAAWTRRDIEPELLLGPQASVAAVGARLAQGRGYRCVHLATHASSVFEGGAADDPFSARLILQDGSIDALTISQWRLDADVVVMSACDSGQRALGGRGLAELPGDDLFGLQAALFEAGARSVVGALWPVDDRVAPVIMARLHDGLAAGVAPDLALQAALVHYLAQPDARRRIYFWAPLFVTSLGRLAGSPHQESQRA